MAEKGIKQRIELEGEKQYSQAINEARRNLRTLRSELKAETAELGANATAQQKNEAKTKSLQKQIKEQEKVVQAYRDALKEVKEKYSDNADAIAQYEQKLNDARTALANMKNSLEQVGNAYRSVNEGAKSGIVENKALADSFDGIVDSAQKMGESIGNVFGGIVGTIKDSVGAVWGELMDIAARANNWTDLASYMNTSTVEIEKWDRAISAAQGDFGKFTTAATKLLYGGKTKDITDWFHISDENYTDDLKYTVAVLQQMVNMKDEMQANGTWKQAISDIFGSKMPKEISWFIDNWGTIQDNLGQFDAENGGAGLGEDQLSTMNELWLQVGLLRESWKAFKDEVATTLFGQISLNVVGNLQGAVDALIAFMNADPNTAEGQAARLQAIEDFKDNITAAFTALGEAIAAAGEALEQAGEAMQGSENGWVKLLGTVLDALGKAMEWIADPEHAEAVKTFFITLGGIWAGAQFASGVANIVKLANSFKTLNTNRALLNALNGNGGSGGTGTPGGTGGAGGPQTVSTETVTNQTVTNATATNFTATNMTVPTETVSNATVANMVVENMVGGQNGLPGANNSGGNPVISNDGSGGMPSLPYGGSNTGLNGFVPVTLPSGGGSALPGGGGGDMYLPNVENVNLSGSQPQLNLPEGDNSIRLDPSEFSIDGENLQPTTTSPNGGGDGSSVLSALEGLAGPAIGTTLGLLALGGIAYGAAQGNWQYAGVANPYQYSSADNKETLEAAVNGILYRNTMNGRWSVGYLAANAKTPEDFVRLFDYEDANGGQMNWLEAVMGGRDQMAQAAIYEIMRGAYGQDFTRNLSPELKSLLEDQGASAYMALGNIDYTSLITGMREFFKDYGAFDEDKNWYIPSSDWWLGGSGSGGTTDENGISRGDVEGLKGIPAGVETAAEAGVRKGISGLRVEIDGQEAGRILAPYVSQEIAREVQLQ